MQKNGFIVSASEDSFWLKDTKAEAELFAKQCAENNLGKTYVVYQAYIAFTSQVEVQHKEIRLSPGEKA